MQNQISLPVIKNNVPLFRVAPGVEGLQVIMVNVYFISHTDETGTRWFLVDAGMGQCAGRIKKAATHLFGENNKPSAILLTHGHFDHVGALADLSAEWDVPVYAHSLEMPYLTGRSSYPPPDPTVGGGLMALMAGVYPKKPIDISSSVQSFPADGTIPGLPGWQVLHTPGHTAGHVSFFRESDRTLIAGDAFVTVKQESLLAVLSQKKEIHGPPAYFTTDWQAAQQSVEILNALHPSVAACGHGKPMEGEALHEKLDLLARYFIEMAVPKQGRYVNQPAFTNKNGVMVVPPPAIDPLKDMGKIGIAVLAGLAVGYWGKKLMNQK